MNFSKTIGYLLLIILMSCGSDNYNKLSQKNNQKFLNEKIKEFYYDRNDLNLKGQVAAILEFDSLSDTIHKNISLIEIDDPKTTIELIKHQMKSEDVAFFRFNNTGQAVQFFNYLKGNHDNYYEYKFNKKGKLTELDRYDFNLKRDKYERYKYDKNGKLMQVKSKDQSDLFIHTSNFFYEDEFMIIRFNHDRDSLDFGESKFKNGYFIEQSEIDRMSNKQYDERGNLIKYDQQSYLADDTLVRHTTIKEYNNNNQVIREIEYGPLNEVIQIESFLYSNDGILLQRVKVEEEETRIWQYNRNKSLINFFSNSHLRDSTYRFTNSLNSYDKFGNKTYENHLSQNPYNGFQKRNTAIKLEYDALGNWTKRHIFENDSLISITGRILWYEN